MNGFGEAPTNLSYSLYSSFSPAFFLFVLVVVNSIQIIVKLNVTRLPAAWPPETSGQGGADGRETKAGSNFI